MKIGSICVSEQQHETSEKGAEAQKHETLLSNEPCQGKAVAGTWINGRFPTETALGHVLQWMEMTRSAQTELIFMSPWL